MDVPRFSSHWSLSDSRDRSFQQKKECGPWTVLRRQYSSQPAEHNILLRKRGTKSIQRKDISAFHFNFMDLSTLHLAQGPAYMRSRCSNSGSMRNSADPMSLVSKKRPVPNLYFESLQPFCFEGSGKYPTKAQVDICKGVCSIDKIINTSIEINELHKILQIKLHKNGQMNQYTYKPSPTVKRQLLPLDHDGWRPQLYLGHRRLRRGPTGSGRLRWWIEHARSLTMSILNIINTSAMFFSLQKLKTIWKII